MSCTSTNGLAGSLLPKSLPPPRVFFFSSCLRVQVPMVRRTRDLGYHLSISVLFPLPCTPSVRSSFLLPTCSTTFFFSRGNTKKLVRSVKRTAMEQHWDGSTDDDDEGSTVGSSVFPNKEINFAVGLSRSRKRVSNWHNCAVHTLVRARIL